MTQKANASEVTLSITARIEAAIDSALAAGHPVHYILLSPSDFIELNQRLGRKNFPLSPGDQWQGYFLEAAESLAVA